MHNMMWKLNRRYIVGWNDEQLWLFIEEKYRVKNIFKLKFLYDSNCPVNLECTSKNYSIIRPSLYIYSISASKVLTVNLLVSNLQATAIIAMKYHLEHHILGREHTEQIQSV